MMANLNPVSQVNTAFEERDAEEKSKHWGFPYVDIATFPINPDVIRGIAPEKIRKAKALPFFRVEKRLKIAVVNPVDKQTQAFLDTLKDDFQIEIHICSQSGLDKAFSILGDKSLNKKTVQVRTDFEENEKLDIMKKMDLFQQLEQKIEKLPTEKAINEIEIFALKVRASDIHLQPSEQEVTLRLRIDGILKTICPIRMDIAKKIIARIKYDSGMKSNVSNIPQDGRISFEANGRKVDLRVSSLPTETLESVVMRVLDSRKGILPFHSQGFLPKLS